MIAASGVHVAQFERFNEQRPWLPCPKRNWCAHIRDRLATSIIHQNQRALYFGEGRGGVVYDPMHVSIHCAYPGDGSSQDKVCSPVGGGEGSTTQIFQQRVPTQAACIPGCYPEGQWCGQPGAGEHGSCSYPPQKLCESLQWQERSFARGPNNEIVLDALSTHFGGRGGAAPPAIAAFFITGTDDDSVRRDRSTFLAAYPGATLPLVSLSLHADPPFKLAQ